MFMNYSRKKIINSFTLVELMIAISISAVFVVLASKLLFEYINVYEDITAECYLTGFAQQLKTKIERGEPTGGVREAVWETLKDDVSDDTEGKTFLQFKTFENIDDSYTKSISDSVGVITTSLKKIGDDFVAEYNNDKSSLGRGKLKIVNVEVIKSVSQSDVNSNPEVNALYNNEKLVTIIYDIEYQHRDKVYKYRLQIDVPMGNTLI